MLFVNKGRSIEVKQTEECNHYAGSGVYFGSEYTKGKAALKEQNFVQRSVFPDIQLDRRFRALVGQDYKSFLDSFQLISENKDLDGFNAKVFEACVRGVCPWVAGIIMFDAHGDLWAAVLNVDNPKKTYVHYYTSDPAFVDKLPKTIENWVNEKREFNDDVTIIFKNKE